MCYHNNRSRISVLVSTLLICAIMLTGCFSLKGKETGIPAKDFTLPDLEGQEISLADYKGSNVLLNFWASWCEPCTEEMPAIEKIHTDYKDNGLAVLTVNPGDEKDAIIEFMKTNQYTFPVLVDTGREVAKVYGTSSVPVTYLIDKEGTIVFKKVGLVTADELKQAIDNLQ